MLVLDINGRLCLQFSFYSCFLPCSFLSLSLSNVLLLIWRALAKLSVMAVKLFNFVIMQEDKVQEMSHKIFKMLRLAEALGRGLDKDSLSCESRKYSIQKKVLIQTGGSIEQTDPPKSPQGRKRVNTRKKVEIIT